MLRWIKRNGITLLLIAVMLIGAGLISYPTFADWMNSRNQSRVVTSYINAVNKTDPVEFERILQAAEAYNQNLAQNGVKFVWTDEERAEYQKQLSLEDSDVMGYITIDKIGVRLPIHHGTDESVLQTAIGHLEWSSLPVGGESSHCIVSGHRGLPSARLFTDLDKMQEGDIFTLSVLDRVFTYQVDQISTVLPNELENLQIEPGKDYCTLVTCTPYGINTHRLLVRGIRIPNLPEKGAETAIVSEGESQAEVQTGWSLPVPVFVAAPLATLGLLIIIFLIRMLMRLMNNNNKGKTDQKHKQEDE